MKAQNSHFMNIDFSCQNLCKCRCNFSRDLQRMMASFQMQLPMLQRSSFLLPIPSKKVSQLLSLPQTPISCNPFDLCTDMGALILAAMLYPYNADVDALGSLAGCKFQSYIKSLPFRRQCIRKLNTSFTPTNFTGMQSCCSCKRSS